MVDREISFHLQTLASQYPVITLTCPRQSGKTTLVRHIFKEKAYINLELLDQREFARSDPRGFLRRIPDGAIQDEIQHVPELLSYIQGIVDESRVNYLFILTGSRQFEILNRVRQSHAGRIGQLLNMNSLGNDAGVSHTTAREWLSLLESSYLVFLLEPFHRNLGKRLIKSPKLYFYDTGLACYLLGIGKETQVDTHPLRGSLFENLVIAELVKFRFNPGKSINLNFYRDSMGNETDVIYNIAQEILPIEIKAGKTVAPEHFKGLLALQKVIGSYAYGRCIVYNGDHEETRRDIIITVVSGLLQLLRRIE